MGAPDLSHKILTPLKTVTPLQAIRFPFSEGPPPQSMVETARKLFLR